MSTAAAEQALGTEVTPMRVVAIGGGTGLSTLLKGLKAYVPPPNEPDAKLLDGPVISELSAIVTVSDDGGSSGRLRKELNMLPPGDIRNCIVVDKAFVSDLALALLDNGHRLGKAGARHGEGQVR